MVAIAFFVLSLLLASTPARSSKAQETTAGPKKLVAYFIEWGIYGRNYLVKNIVTSGAATRLTHINYAFANVAPDQGDPSPTPQVKCQIGDAWADYQKDWTAEQSVDGVATVVSDTLRGNFQQLKRLKELHPKIKVLIALGGWTWSSHFSDMAVSAESREAFVTSCIDMFIKGNLPGLPAGAGAGVFDGIDIDWEYPGSCGNTCDFRPEDKQNFTLLLAEFRRQLNEHSIVTGKPYLLTIATTAGKSNTANLELRKIHRYVNFINVMTYDFHGTWETTTNFNSPLWRSPSDPARATGSTTVEAIQRYLDGGVPPGKLVVGVPFYGKGWQGVPNVNNGLYQPATGAAPGTYEAGTDDYKVLKAKLASGDYARFFNAKTKNAWLYDATNGIFWTYDDVLTMTHKARFVNEKQLGGVMFWELSGDTADGELVKTLRRTLQ